MKNSARRGAVAGIPPAAITFDNDAVLWLGGPIAAAVAVLIAGVLLRRRSPRAAWALLVLGSAGLILALLWVALALYVDAVVQ